MNKKLLVKNTFANFLSRVMNRGVRIFLVPFQVNLLGEQAFGLLGLYAIVSSMIAVLDLGLTFTARREVARLNTGGVGAKQEIRNLIRTFELPYWLIALFLGVAAFLSAGWFTDHWITAPDLSRNTVLFSVTMIGVTLAARWPVSLYSGILYGLNRQVEVNFYAIVVEVLNGVGSIVVLLLYHKVEIFFLFQLAMGVFEITGYMWLCQRAVSDHSLPRPTFQVAIFRRVWRYALGVNIGYLVGTIFDNTDGLILSKLYPVNFLGYYSVAVRASSIFGIFSGSILSATTPSIVSQYEQRNYDQLSRLYHRQARWLALLCVGTAFPMAIFSYEILRLWTRSETVARAAALPLAIIALCSVLEITSNSVNQLSLACGFTRFPIIVSCVEGMIVVVGALLLAPRFGIVGAAMAWGLARIIKFIIYPILVHQHLLQGEAKNWFLQDTLPVFVLGGISFGSSALIYHYLFANSHSLTWLLMALFATGLYIGLIFAFNLFPEWRTLLLVPRVQSLLKMRNANSSSL